MSSENNTSSKSIDLKVTDIFLKCVCFSFSELFESARKPGNGHNVDFNNLYSIQNFYLKISKSLTDKLMLFQNPNLSDKEAKSLYHGGDLFGSMFLGEYYPVVKGLDFETRQLIYKMINTVIIPKLDICFDILSYKIQQRHYTLKLLQTIFKEQYIVSRQ